MRSVTASHDKLCRLSRAARADAEAIDWPEAMAHDAQWFSPELCSLADTPTYERLGEEERSKLARAELANFFSLNIHGERRLIAGLAGCLYDGALEPFAEYIHHFIDEENVHMGWFGGFCRRYGRIYPSRFIEGGTPFAPAQRAFVFFARVFVFEQIVDHYNKTMGDDARLASLVRTINRRHHEDESRHLAFGRLMLDEIHRAEARSWTVEQHTEVAAHLEQFLRASWREYFNVDVYRDAGIAQPYQARREAIEANLPRRRAISARAIRTLTELGIFDKEPSL